MVARPGEAFILGGDWRIPVVEGLQPANYIQQQESDISVDPAGFDREYESKWSGTIEGAFFTPDAFDRNRVLNHAENEFNKKSSEKAYYVMGVDVGRLGLNIGSSKISLIAGTSFAYWIKRQSAAKS